MWCVLFPFSDVVLVFFYPVLLVEKTINCLLTPCKTWCEDKNSSKYLKKEMNCVWFMRTHTGPECSGWAALRWADWGRCSSSHRSHTPPPHLQNMKIWTRVRFLIFFLLFLHWKVIHFIARDRSQLRSWGNLRLEFKLETAAERCSTKLSKGTNMVMVENHIWSLVASTWRWKDWTG